MSDESGLNCYICYEEFTEANPQVLPLPCHCRGSMGIHLPCLREILETRLTCATCKHRYNRQQYWTDYQKLLAEIEGTPSLLRNYKRTPVFVLAAVKRNPDVFMHIDAADQTAEICTEALCEYANFGGPIPQDIYKAIRKDLRDSEAVQTCLADLFPRHYFQKIMKTPEKQTREIVLKVVNNFGERLECVREDLKTREVCMAAIEAHGCAYKFVPDELRTDPEICMAAVQADLPLDKLPPECITSEMAMTVVSECPWELEHVPDAIITEDMCRLACGVSACAYAHVPTRFRTPAVLEMAMEQRNNWLLLLEPDFQQTAEFCMQAVTKNPRALRHVKNEFRTPELLLEAVKAHSSSIGSIPRSKHTEELVNAALAKDPCDVLKHIQQTPEICKRAVEDNIYCISYIKPEFITDELIEHVKQTLFGGLGNYYRLTIVRGIPERYFTAEFCEKLVDIDDEFEVIRFLPSKFLTTELVIRAFRKSLEAGGWGGEWHLFNNTRKIRKYATFTQFKMPCLEALLAEYPKCIYRMQLTAEETSKCLRINPRCFEHIYKKTRSICKEAVDLDGTLLEFVPPQFLSKPLSLKAVQITCACGTTKGAAEAEATMRFVPEKLKAWIRSKCGLAETAGSLLEIPTNV